MTGLKLYKLVVDTQTRSGLVLSSCWAKNSADALHQGRLEAAAREHYLDDVIDIYAVPVDHVTEFI